MLSSIFYSYDTNPRIKSKLDLQGTNWGSDLSNSKLILKKKPYKSYSKSLKLPLSNSLKEERLKVNNVTIKLKKGSIEKQGAVVRETAIII